MAEESALYVSPLPAGTTFARVDQGVDYESSSPYLAVGSGVVTHTSPAGSWAGGTGEAVYIGLDNPITVNGRTYSEVYYAEQHPLVSFGQRVTAGQPVMAGGGAELGFARNSQPACALVGGLGAGTQPTQCGRDFQAFVASAAAGTASGGKRAAVAAHRPPRRRTTLGPPSPVTDAHKPTHLPAALAFLFRALGTTVPSTGVKRARDASNSFLKAVR